MPVRTEPIVIRYVPVSARILKIVGMTDNFLHAAGVAELRTSEKQEALRSLLSEGVSRMEESLSGALRGPLVRGPDGHIQIVIDDDLHPELQASLRRGDSVMMRIDISPLLNEGNA